jgi:hypothetical protein
VSWSALCIGSRFKINSNLDKSQEALLLLVRLQVCDVIVVLNGVFESSLPSFLMMIVTLESSTLKELSPKSRNGPSIKVVDREEIHSHIGRICPLFSIV